MAHIDDLMEKVDTKFHLVHLAAKRAREINAYYTQLGDCLLYTSPSPRDLSTSRMPSSA